MQVFTDILRYGKVSYSHIWSYQYFLTRRVGPIDHTQLFWAPSLLAEGLLSMGPTPSSFYLLGEMELPLHLKLKDTTKKDTTMK